MSLSPLQELARLPRAAQEAWLVQQPDWAIRDMVAREWWWVARAEQRAPLSPWLVWLILSGRGFGKTRSGSEWLADRAERYPLDAAGVPTEHLLIAETMTDAMRQCIDGPAGLRRVLERRLGPARRSGVDGTGRWRLWKAPKPWVELYPAGTAIYLDGADDADVGRGYNATSAWLDEFAKWPKPDESWREGIMPSLRADVPGDHPRCVVTTTPKPVVQLIEWSRRADGTVAVTRGSTYDNAANLAAVMLQEFHRRYHGTSLGRQELHGELIEEAEGALWQYDLIERYRVTRVPQLIQVVVAMDAAGGDQPTSDECGLVAAGRGADGRDYILGDWSTRVTGAPAARRAWEMYREYGAGWLVAEDNQGKRWLWTVLASEYRRMQDEGLFPAGGAPPIRMVTAKIAKRLRAEPVVARYEQGQVSHAAVMADLETQMISWEPASTSKSPDRVDAMVYAVLWLGGSSRPGEIINPVDTQLVRAGAYGTG